MADKEDGHTITPRGADWEVVSLTASAYAAAPGGNMPEFKHGEKGEVVDKDEVEASNALFMSDHFVLPPGHHQNVTSEFENTENLDQRDDSESVEELGEKTDAKEEENWDLGKLTELDFAENDTLSGKEQSIYSSPTLHSLQNSSTIGTININDETSILDESILSTNISTKQDDHEGSCTPNTSWLRKQAAAFYAHANETNAFWSIFAAAAVMGIVIIGQQWHQERCRVFNHEWKSRIHDEKIRMMTGPISRFKDTIIGVLRQDFSIKGSISREL